jgi:hypothetical protein
VSAPTDRTEDTGTALPAELAAFVQSGLSISVCGRDERLVPSLAKGAGCRVRPDGRELTVLLTPEFAFAQTPGPNAGAPVCLAPRP